MPTSREMEGQYRNPTRHKLREVRRASRGWREQGNVHAVYAEYASVASGRPKDCKRIIRRSLAQ